LLGYPDFDLLELGTLMLEAELQFLLQPIAPSTLQKSPQATVKDGLDIIY